MTGVICVLIAVFSPRWRGALTTALVIGIPASILFGVLRAEDTGVFGDGLNIGFLVIYAGIGAASFVGETMLFFAIKIGIRQRWARRRKSGTVRPDSSDGLEN